MATSRQRTAKAKRNRALRGKQLVREENLAPMIAAGLTQGVPWDEVKKDLLADPAPPDGAELVRHMAREETTGRVPLPKFVGEDAASDMVVTFADGRVFREVRKTFTPETFRALRSGMICLKCLEPQPFAFADAHLPGCEGVSLAGPTYMKDRQIMDIAMEFEGEKHIGPSKPISEYLDEIELRAEQRRFLEKIENGKSPMKGLRRA